MTLDRGGSRGTSNCCGIVRAVVRDDDDTKEVCGPIDGTKACDSLRYISRFIMGGHDDVETDIPG